MKFAVSVISPPGYMHNEASREVAESIHHALRSLGHDSILTARTDCPGRRHIVLGSNLLPHHHVELAPESILYNLEQITPDSPWLHPALLQAFRRYPLWDYSRQNIAQLRRIGIEHVEHVPIGYVPQLTRIFPVDEDIDVLFIGSVNKRRADIIQALRDRGVQAEAVFGVYGAERDALIARSKIVLNMHYYDAKVFEVVRVSYLLANGRFVVSERGASQEEEAPFDDGVVFVGYDQLVDTCVDYLARPRRRAEIAAAGLEIMRGRPQETFLDAVIRGLAAEQFDHTAIGDRRRDPGEQGGASVVAPVEIEKDKGVMTMTEDAPRPRVSVVMPVFNHADLTASCLTSLVETTDDCGVNLELIVVDNGSTDETPALLANLVEGDVTVLCNDANRGFGEACNQGAAAARGEYILFLNNDTVLLPGWLPPLVAALDEDARRGAVQPRLIYPDGRLNDAGGLVFRDGEAWVYGKGSLVSDAPLYATRRAPDYASGACLLVRRAAFAEVGGFDPRYAPAYYEDADLSFALRAAGWTLLYEPASTVVHLEGGTAGTDETAGLKRYQARNRAVFARKWADDLNRRPRLDPAMVDAWAHRGQSGLGPGEDPSLVGANAPSRTVLSIDLFPPMWDRAGGGLRTMQLLRGLREEGHAVAHIAARAAPERRRYAAALGRFGVPLYGVDPAELPDDPAARASMQAACLPDLTTIVRRHEPGVVLLSPWSVAEQLIDPLRELLPDATFVVDTCDIHFVRELRAAALGADAALLQRARANRARELAVYAKADRIVCVSEEDAAAVREALPACEVVIAGIAHDQVDSGPDYADREGILFVGNANHTPNLDAVRWWQAEIAPRLAERLPGVRLTVVGNDPAGSMRALAGGDVQALGWVPETLPYLHAARVSVAPLRFGAGVKGKVGEALMAGLPVVGTSIAVEGLGLLDGQHALVADGADEFVDQIVRVYTDPALWGRLREQGLSHARTRLSAARLREAASAIVTPKPAQVTAPAEAAVRQRASKTADAPVGLKRAVSISLVMNTHNEAHNLAGVVDSCVGIDEILVADMASSDGSVDIARRLGARVVELPFSGYCEPGRQPAIDAASGEWVLLLDGDERLSPGGLELLRELAAVAPPSVSAYRLPRPLFVGGKRVHGTGWGVDVERHPRFFRRRDVSWPALIHAVPTFAGQVCDLPPGMDVRLDHYAFPNIEAAYAKFNRYTGVEATERVAAGASAIQPAHILDDAIAEFVRRYEPDRDGALSFALSMGMFMYKFMSGMKVVERLGWPDAFVAPGRDSMRAAWSSFQQALREAELARIRALANGMLQRGDVVEAAKQASSAVVQWGGDPALLTTAAAGFAAAGDRATAIECLEAAAVLDPANVQVERLLAQLSVDTSECAEDSAPASGSARSTAETWPADAPDCPICGGRDLTYLFQARRQGDHVWRCSCGLVTYWPRPTGETLLDYYDEDYIWAGDGHGYAGGYVAAERATASRFERYAFNSILPRILDGASYADILDVGAATGLFVEMAQQRGLRARGVEPSAAAVKVAHERGRPVRLGGLEDEEAHSADIVTLWDVVEHVDQPVTLFQQAAAVLRPGGRIVIRTQDVSSPEAGAAGEHWEQYVSAHVMHFSPATLRHALHRAGFEGIDVIERDGYMFTTVASMPATLEPDRADGDDGGTVRLNLACGDDRRPGWINIDAFAPADLQMDLLNLQLPDAVADEILLSHALEHFSTGDVELILAECRRVLKPGGRLCVNVPDLEWVLRNWLALREEDRWGWPLATIFGLQDNPGEYHRTGFSRPRLERLLRRAGFGHVRVAPLFSHGQGCLWAEAWPVHEPRRPGLSVLLSPDDAALTEYTVRHLVEILPEDVELVIAQRQGDAGPFLAQLEGAITWLSNSDPVSEEEGLAQAASIARADSVLLCRQGTAPSLDDVMPRTEAATRPEPAGLIPACMRRS